MFEVDGGDEIVWTFDRQLALGAERDLHHHGVRRLAQGHPRRVRRAGPQGGRLHLPPLHRHRLQGNLYTGETINGRRIQKFVPIADLDDARTTTFRPSGYPDVALRHYDPRNPGQPDGDDRSRSRRRRDPGYALLACSREAGNTLLVICKGALLRAGIDPRMEEDFFMTRRRALPAPFLLPLVACVLLGLRRPRARTSSSSRA